MKDSRGNHVSFEVCDLADKSMKKSKHDHILLKTNSWREACEMLHGLNDHRAGRFAYVRFKSVLCNA